MKTRLFFLFVLMLSMTVNILGQNAGDYYQEYENAVQQGDYSKAVKALEKCNSMSNESPMSSFSLGLMYLTGKGLPVDTTKAMVQFLSTTSYEYRYNAHVTIDFLKNMGASPSDIKKAEDEIKENDRQYKLYLKPSPLEENLIISFARRWLGCLSFQDATDTEETYEDRMDAAASALKDLEKADSLTQDAYSQYLLGRIYYEGLIGMRDQTKGMRLIERAAEKGSISALTYLGDITMKQGDKKGARELWKAATKIEILPIPLMNRRNALSFRSPNIDIFDVRKMQQHAAASLKQK